MTLTTIILQAITHPLFLTFGQTTEKDFPIVLIVGREPNNNSVSDKTVGQYDFIKYSNCAFWNIAFKVFSAYNGLTTPQVKQLFIQQNASPVVFTDASPKGIQNKVKDKNAIRSTLTDEEISKHVEAIFANDKLMKRVKLVLFSGLEDAKYNKFKTLFNEQAAKRQMPIKEVSFFIGNNYSKIEKQISDKEILLLKQIFNSFK